MFDHYFNDYVGFTSIPKRKLPPKFPMLDVKLYGTENPYHHMRNNPSATTSTGIRKHIFPMIFP